MDAHALQRSWDRVTAYGEQVPLYFYSHLFVSHPEVRSMFPLAMSHQRDKLVSALGRIVSHADRIDEDLDFMRHLGRDHRKYAVIAEHYNAVGASLCATLKHFLGDEWDAELAAEWTAAYHYLPGQSISMEIPQRPRQWRYFSPANAPRTDGSIDLHVQQIDGGQVSTAVVRSLKPGDTVKLGAAVGERLTLRADDPSDLLLVAGGTGLAPLRAVVEQIDQEWRRTRRVPRVHLVRKECSTARLSSTRARSRQRVASAEVSRLMRAATVGTMS